MHLTHAAFEYLAAVALFFLTWFAVGWRLTRWRVAVEWDPEFRVHPLVLRSMPLLWVGYHAAPLLNGLTTFQWAESAGVYSNTGARTFLTALLLFLVPTALAKVILAHRVARLERQFAGDPDPEHFAATVRIYRFLMLSSLSYYALLFWCFLGDGWGGVLAAGFIGGLSSFSNRLFHNRRRRIPPGRNEARFAFPELPLKTEIETILKEIVKPLRLHDAILVQPPRNGSDPFKAHLMYPTWSRKLQPVVPIAVLQHLDSDIYTAALARDLACSRLPWFESHSGRKAVYSTGCLTILAGGGVLLFAAMVTPSGPGKPFIVAILSCIIFLAFWHFVLGPLIRETGRDCYRDAFLAWYDADPPAGRTVEVFVAALARADTVIECISRPEVVLHRLKRDRALMAFLDYCGPEVRRAALEAAQMALLPLESRPARS